MLPKWSMLCVSLRINWVTNILLFPSYVIGWVSGKIAKAAWWIAETIKCGYEDGRI